MIGTQRKGPSFEPVLGLYLLYTHKEEKFIMKLKKIASLALAGIMAVSMLAGCGEAASSSEPTTPPGDCYRRSCRYQCRAGQ